MGREKKLKLGLKKGAEVGDGVRNSPKQIWLYLIRILLNSFPTSSRYANFTFTQIYNTKRSSDKQSESVNVRP